MKNEENLRRIEDKLKIERKEAKKIMEENGGKEGILYQSFSDDELEHIFKSAYVKNDKR